MGTKLGTKGPLVICCLDGIASGAGEDVPLGALDPEFEACLRFREVLAAVEVVARGAAFTSGVISTRTTSSSKSSLSASILKALVHQISMYLGSMPSTSVGKEGFEVRRAGVMVKTEGRRSESCCLLFFLTSFTRTLKYTLIACYHQPSFCDTVILLNDEHGCSRRIQRANC
jgi:hypothetical protein